MSQFPTTEIQRRLDADFEAMFANPLPLIARPLSPEEVAEAEQTQVRA